jgi:hypothetical protein
MQWTDAKIAEVLAAEPSITAAADRAEAEFRREMEEDGVTDFTGGPEDEPDSYQQELFGGEGE